MKWTGMARHAPKRWTVFSPKLATDMRRDPQSVAFRRIRAPGIVTSEGRSGPQIQLSTSNVEPSKEGTGLQDVSSRPHEAASHCRDSVLMGCRTTKLVQSARGSNYGLAQRV